MAPPEVLDHGLIDQGLPDPGSRPVPAEGFGSCAEAEAGLEFYPVPIWNFEGGVASNFYQYVDQTSHFLEPRGWEPPTEDDGWSFAERVDENGIPRHRCDRELNYALHIKGGPFTEWGGGMGRHLKCMNRTDQVYFGPRRVGEELLEPSCGQRENGACETELEPLGETPEQRELRLGACPERDRTVQACVERKRAEAGDPYKDVSMECVDEVTEDQHLLGVTLDLTGWEGISFWARRGPNGQSGIRVAFGDKYTDDDLSYLQYHMTPDVPRYCERKRNCDCANHKPCSPAPAPDDGEPCTRAQECYSGSCVDGFCEQAHFCYDPAVDPHPLKVATICSGQADDDPTCYVRCEGAPCANRKPCSTFDWGTPDPVDDVKICWEPVADPLPGTAAAASAFGGEGAPGYRRCSPGNDGEARPGGYACNFFHEAFQRDDIQFKGEDVECRPSAMMGSLENDYCLRPGESAPESMNLCGDHWLAVVRLSTDWQFYKVRFDELLQQGWAKRQWLLDLKSAAVVRFTWDRGWVDYYIDDVRFYRTKRE